jgi:hypothetical protein
LGTAQKKVSRAEAMILLLHGGLALFAVQSEAFRVWWSTVIGQDTSPYLLVALGSWLITVGTYFANGGLYLYLDRTKSPKVSLCLASAAAGSNRRCTGGF